MKALLLLFSVFNLATALVAQGPIYVDAAALGANNGTSWGHAYTDLTLALSATTSGGGPRRA